MKHEEQADNLRQEKKTAHFDLSEEGSKRPEGPEATNAARRAEKDGAVNASDGGPEDGRQSGFFGENKVATSLDDEA